MSPGGVSLVLPPPVRSAAGSAVGALRNLAAASAAADAVAVAAAAAAAGRIGGSGSSLGGGGGSALFDGGANAFLGVPGGSFANALAAAGVAPSAAATAWGSSVFPSCWYTAALHSNAINDALGNAACNVLREAMTHEPQEESGKGMDNMSLILAKLSTTA